MLDDRVLDPPVTKTGHRIPEVDIVRGFALFGILICNAVAAVTQWSPDRAGSSGDRLVLATVDALFSARFYPVFAFLFGYAFTLQVTAAVRVGASPAARLLRRCAVLMVVGLLHLFLLWDGDILTLYAALGVILVAVRALGPRSAALAGATLSITWAMGTFLPGRLPGDGLRMPEVAYTGTAAETFAAQLTVAPTALLLVWAAGAVPSLAMFLFGLAAGKRNLLAQPNTGRTRVVLGAGLCAGLPLSALTFAATMQWWTPPPLLPGLQALVNPLMSFAYIAAVVLAARSPWARRYCAVLAPAGRMAASNYIGQSIVLMVVYTGYGFALADDASLGTVVAIGVLTFAAQLGLSHWWLRRHPYGPVEWVLRAGTYLTVPTWHLRSVDQSAGGRWNSARQRLRPEVSGRGTVSTRIRVRSGMAKESMSVRVRGQGGPVVSAGRWMSAITSRVALGASRFRMLVMAVVRTSGGRD
ncbi:DUF418 domain-containing protein [Nocardia sp. NPDC058658]|uniref:DUF418 domain-containing protein n=1 Tax=Nocardia sp. NPDC058658 TaxID=3346580 RepID=UPI00365E574E